MHCFFLLDKITFNKISVSQLQFINNMEEEKSVQFAKEEVAIIVKDAVETVINFETLYQHNKVSHWVNSIIETCMKRLTSLGKPFKYIVTCVIMQNNGAGFHTASSCFWDASDGYYIHKFEGKKFVLYNNSVRIVAVNIISSSFSSIISISFVISSIIVPISVISIASIISFSTSISSSIIRIVSS